MSNSQQLRAAQARVNAQFRQQQQQQAQALVPRGAPSGAIAGAAALAAQGYGYAPAVPQQGYAPVPQGADQGALAGCGGNWPSMPGSCGPIQPMMAMSSTNNLWSWVQQCSLLGVVVTPTTTGSTTLEVACGGSIYQGIGGRSFNQEGEYGFNSITSGFNSLNLVCPDSTVDVAFFRTDQCFCPFDFGCFWTGAPLILTFSPITTASTIPVFNFIIVGMKYETNACFPPPFFGPGTPPPSNIPVG